MKLKVAKEPWPASRLVPALRGLSPGQGIDISPRPELEALAEVHKLEFGKADVTRCHVKEHSRAHSMNSSGVDFAFIGRDPSAPAHVARDASLRATASDASAQTGRALPKV